MSIATYLNKIKYARLGREVRDAIHDAISTTYDDAVTAASPNAEVAAARGTYANLKARLDAADAVISSSSDAIDDCEADIVSLDTRVDALEAVNGLSRLVFNTYTEATDWVRVDYTETVPVGSVLMFCIQDRNPLTNYCVTLLFYATNYQMTHYFTASKYIVAEFNTTGYCNVRLYGFTLGAVFRIVKLL